MIFCKIDFYLEWNFNMSLYVFLFCISPHTHTLWKPVSNFNKLHQMLLLLVFQTQSAEKELIQNKFISLMLYNVKFIKIAQSPES